jgi:CRISPR-associated protein Cas1
MRRTVHVSGEGKHLRCRDAQVQILHGDKVLGSVPAEDIGLLIVDTAQATYSHTAVSAILGNGGVVVFCGPDHLPVGIAHPAVGHHAQTERFRVQVESSVPTRKRLWQQIVRQKIRNQAAICENEATRKRLELLAGRVKSGDPSNVEAQAAKVHWSAYLPEAEGFRRLRDGPFPNSLLNYGYTVMRATIARSVVAAGFHPALGLNHSNRSNPFCLADDLVEPLRPLVDVTVRNLVRRGSRGIEKEEKQELLSLLTFTCRMKGQSSPLINALDTMAASLHACYLGESRELDIPHPHWDLAGDARDMAEGESNEEVGL